MKDGLRKLSDFGGDRASEVDHIDSILDKFAEFEGDSKSKQHPEIIGGLIVGTVIAAIINRIEASLAQENGAGNSLVLVAIGTVIAWAIFSLTTWGALTCRKYLGYIARVRETIDDSVVDAIVFSLRANGLDKTRAALRRVEAGGLPFFLRLGALLDQWKVDPNLEGSLKVLGHHQERDFEDLFARYSLLRVVIWALPVFGLVGTVLGIALSIGGFSQLLAGSVDVVQIRTQLVGVTGGLSSAFLLTLEGLGTSLAVMLLVSLIQGQDERALRDIGKIFDYRILPALKDISPAAGPSRNADDQFDLLFAGLSRRMSEVISAMGDEMAAMLSDAAVRNLARVEEVAAASRDRIAEFTQESCNIIARTAADTASSADAVARSFAEDLRELSHELFDRQESSNIALQCATDSFSNAADALAAGLSAHIADTCQVIDRLQRAMDGIRLSGMSETLSELARSLDTLRPTLTELSRPMKFGLIPYE